MGRKSRRFSKYKKRMGSKKRSSKIRRSLPRTIRRYAPYHLCRHRFGQGRSPNMPETMTMMGNYAPSQMSTFQQYTGMPPFQYNNHITSIPQNLQSNFYRNV